MLRLTIRQLWFEKRRLLGTALAVVLGIAFLTGTLSISDTIRNGFRELFTSVNEEVDAVVRGKTQVLSEFGSQSALIERSLLETIRGIDGVAIAEPEIEASAQIIGTDGKAVGGDGPPTIGLSAVPAKALQGYDLIDGRLPDRTNEVALLESSADSAGVGIGDRVTIRTPSAVTFTVVGLVDLAGGVSGGGVTFSIFTLSDAQRYMLNGADKVTRILVSARDGVDEDELVDRITAVLPEGAEAISGTAFTQELIDEINDGFLNFFTTMLVVFAGIALLVACFSIYNTFSITVAQRTRQTALLRIVGASRAQIIRSIVIEAVLVGAFASVVGLITGVALASFLKVALDAFGFPMTSGLPELRAGTVVAAFVVGIAATTFSGIVPAIRGSRVAPLAALRDVSVDRSDTSRARALTGVMVTGAGVVAVILAAIGVGPVFLLLALGSLATLIGVVVLGPVAARPVSAGLGSPVARFRGLTGELAQQNAMRNPRRTAATASALMIGIAVVTLFTVVAASMKSTIDTEVRRRIGGQLILSAGGFSGTGLSPKLAQELDELDEVEVALGIGIGAGEIDGEDRIFAVADMSRFGDVTGLEIVDGSTDLGADGIAVTEDNASSDGLEVGDVVPVTFVDGKTEDLTVRAIFEAGPGGGFGGFLIPPAVWESHAVQRSDIRVIVRLAEGVTVPQGRAVVEPVAQRYGSPLVQDQAEYAEEIAGQLDQVLSLIYVLLTLAIVIALMGIANALSLSIHERVREIGLLRAVGQTRRQLRSMVRWESVLVALFGTIGGIGLGTFLGWAAIRAVSAEEGFGLFATPFGQLVLILGVGAFVGLVAAVRPARRAARIDMLRAIAAE